LHHNLDKDIPSIITIYYRAIQKLKSLIPEQIYSIITAITLIRNCMHSNVFKLISPQFQFAQTHK